MIEDAKAVLKSVVEHTDMYLEGINGRLVVGNLQALECARARGQKETFESRVKSLEGRVRDVEANNERLEANNERLYSRIVDLEVSSTTLKNLRNRFISTYKRDKLATAEDYDFKFIASGNRFAHSGNCKRDAELYTAGGRTDIDVYILLYGLHPGIVNMMTYRPTITTLDTHATIVASNHKTASEQFHILFANFIKALQESHYVDKFLERNDTARLSGSYSAFLDCLKTEVSDQAADE